MTQKASTKPTISLEKIFNFLQNLAQDVQEIQKELRKRPTRDEVRVMVREEVREELKNYPTKYELNDKLTQLKSDFFDKIDPLLVEIEDNREHRTLVTNDIREINETLDDHEKRIKKFEQH